MKNLDDLRVQLADVFSSVKSGDMDTKRAAELSNVAGKLISSVTTQLKYYALRREIPTIAFADSTTKPRKPRNPVEATNARIP